LNELFGVVAGLLALTGAIVFFGLKKSGDPRIPGRSYAQVAGVSFLVGLNFILLEHYVVLSVFKKMYVFQDSLALGAVSFLIVSGCGSVFITQRSRAPIQVAALACLGTVVFLEKHLPVAALLACLLPVAFATGSFFPAIFELACRNPLAVFAMDAVGAAVGSALAFFIPIAFGLSVFFPIAALVFAATSFLSSRFCGYNLQNLVTPAPRPQVFSS